jgi:hypothetical protein
MKTVFTAINKAFSILKSVDSGITIPVYKYRKRTKEKPAEYIVINSLPINAELMQQCIVNVNYHVKNIDTGVPDIDKLEAKTELVVDLLNETVDLGEQIDILIDLESQEVISEDAPIEEHYSNMRFLVKIVNKQ